MARTIEDAISFAAASHSGRVDKGGKPQIFHPLRVMLRIAILFPDDGAIQAAAVLHDVVEDCDVTLNQLSHRFGQEVADIVESVSRGVYYGGISDPSGTKEPYRDFILRAKMHPKGRAVKIADIEDNTDPIRMQDLPIEEVGSMVKRYKMALDLLRS